MAKKKTIDVLIPHGYKPQKVEIQAAWILAGHYGAVVKILRPTMGYKEKTADFQIDENYYELKTPTSRKTEHITWLFRSASKQADIIVIDARKTKIHENRMVELCEDRLRHIKKLRRVVLIISKKKVLDFTK